MNTSFDTAKQAIVRIFTCKGTVVGTGFLVCENYIVTCAHVIAQALGIKQDVKTRPNEDILLDFPFINPEIQLTANVVLWRPVPSAGEASVAGKEDIAILKLNNSPPANLKPVKLFVETNLRGDEFLTFGFPVNHDDGLEAGGKLGGKQAAGWVQIEGGEVGTRLERGFSGAPIWDEKLKGIVGMAVAADDSRKEAKIGFMIPVEEIVRVFQEENNCLNHLLILHKSNIWGVVPRTYRTTILLLTSLSIVLFTIGYIPHLEKIISQVLGVPTIKQKCNESYSGNPKDAQAIGVATVYSNKTISDGIAEASLIQELDRSNINNLVLCRIETAIPDNQEAKKIAKILEKQFSTVVIVWINKGATSFIGGVEVSAKEKDAGSVDLPSGKIADWTSDFETEDLPSLVTILTKLAISKSYYFQGNIQQAKEVLVMDNNIARELAKNPKNRESIANAYFFKGFLFNNFLQEGCQTLDDCNKAVKSYTEAFNLSGEKLYVALLNLGKTYERLNKFTAAKLAYTKIIDAPLAANDLIIDSLKNRVLIFIKESNYQAAKADFQKLIERDSIEGHLWRAEVYTQHLHQYDVAIEDLKYVISQDNNILYYHFLGLVQLRANKPEVRHTYRKIKCFTQDLANVSTIQYIMEDLQKLSEREPNMTDRINTVLNDLQSQSTSENIPCE